MKNKLSFTLLSACLRAGFCLVLLLSAHASHGQTVKTVSLNNGSILEVFEETTPSRNVEITDDGVIVTYRFKYMSIQQDWLYKSSYFLRINGFGQMDHPGLPSVPTHMDSFTVPPGFTASVSMLDSAFVEIPLRLAPARKPLLINDSIGHTFDNVPPIKTDKDLFPFQILLGKESHQFLDCQIFNVAFSPVKYDCQNEKAFLYSYIKYKISFDPSPKLKNKGKEGKNCLEANNFLNNVTLNGTQGLRQGKNLSPSTGQEQKKDYLIISVPIYEEAVEDFAVWKRKMGFNVHVEYRDNWNPDSVINIVQDRFSCYDNLVYLLIVGGHQDIPAKHIESVYNNSYYTDYYYGCINNNMYQEICVGRIPVETLEEASVVLGKIINYEENPIDDTNFYQSVLACSQFQDEQNHLNSLIREPDGYEDMRFTQTSEEIVNYLADRLGYNVNRVYKTNDNVNPTYWNYEDNGDLEIPNYLKRSSGFNWNGDKDSINNYLEEGTFLTIYNGHGASGGWSQPQYEGYYITYELNNQRKTPVVFSMSCSTGRFIHEGGKSFSESFLWKENGGCVGIISATETTFGGHTDILEQGMIDAIWPTPGLLPQFRGIAPNYSSHIAVYQLGDILRQGNKILEESGYCTEYPNESTGINNRKRTREVFHCLGDPSMQLYTSKPIPFSNVSIEGSTTFCNVDLGNDTGTITFYNQQTNNVECFIGSNASYSGLTDNLVVCISGHNRIPYISTSNDFQTFYLQNETIGGTKTFRGNQVKMGTNVTNEKLSGPVIFNGTKTTIIGHDINISGETTIELGTEFEVIPE